MTYECVVRVHVHARARTCACMCVHMFMRVCLSAWHGGPPPRPPLCSHLPPPPPQACTSAAGGTCVESGSCIVSTDLCQAAYEGAAGDYTPGICPPGCLLTSSSVYYTSALYPASLSDSGQYVACVNASLYAQCGSQEFQWECRGVAGCIWAPHCGQPGEVYVCDGTDSCCVTGAGNMATVQVGGGEEGEEQGTRWLSRWERGEVRGGIGGERGVGSTDAVGREDVGGQGEGVGGSADAMGGDGGKGGQGGGAGGSADAACVGRRLRQQHQPSRVAYM